MVQIPLIVNEKILLYYTNKFFIMVRFDDLWKSHPGTAKPCNETLFQNQCAIRMSLALHQSKVDLMSFAGVKCWEKHEDRFRHILRAQELANWINVHPEIFGNTLKLER